MTIKKDNVNVRVSPVDGKSFGKIGRGNTVKFIEKKSDWCRIITPAFSIGRTSEMVMAGHSDDLTRWETRSNT